jgi:glycosyltransferase involved in cell wall biosynthesis
VGWLVTAIDHSTRTTQYDGHPPLKIIQTIAGIQASHGGTSRSVPALCEALAAETQHAIHLLATSPPRGENNCWPSSPVVCHEAASSRVWGRLWSGYGYERILTSLISPGAQVPQDRAVIHDHGLWLATNHSVARFCRQHKVPRVVSPRGMLSEWAVLRNSWKKKVAWYAYQQQDLMSATAFHVTSALEAEDVRRMGLRQPVAVIPNGITFPRVDVARERRPGTRRMLFLSRIHPKKGLIELIQAWKKTASTQGWELVLVGPDEGGYAGTVQNQIDGLGLRDQIRLEPPVTDAEKWQTYAKADVFVLPSFSENFGLVIAEALAAGLPVLTTTGTPWNDLIHRGCGWWVAPTVAELHHALEEILAMPSDALAQMGMRGSEWVRQEFQWSTVAAMMSEFYDWLLNPSSVAVPEFVQQH